MTILADSGLLLEISDWHALSLELATRLRATGRHDLARRVEAGADRAFGDFVGIKQ